MSAKLIKENKKLRAENKALRDKNTALQDSIDVTIATVRAIRDSDKGKDEDSFHYKCDNCGNINGFLVTEFSGSKEVVCGSCNNTWNVDLKEME